MHQRRQFKSLLCTSSTPRKQRIEPTPKQTGLHPENWRSGTSVSCIRPTGPELRDALSCEQCIVVVRRCGVIVASCCGSGSQYSSRRCGVFFVSCCGSCSPLDFGSLLQRDRLSQLEGLRRSYRFPRWSRCDHPGFRPTKTMSTSGRRTPMRKLLNLTFLHSERSSLSLLRLHRCQD